MAGTKSLTTESYLATNYKINIPNSPGSDNSLIEDANTVLNRYRVVVSGGTSHTLRCPSQDEISAYPNSADAILSYGFNSDIDVGIKLWTGSLTIDKANNSDVFTDTLGFQFSIPVGSIPSGQIESRSFSLTIFDESHTNVIYTSSVTGPGNLQTFVYTYSKTSGNTVFPINIITTNDNWNYPRPSSQFRLDILPGSFIVNTPYNFVQTIYGVTTVFFTVTNAANSSGNGTYDCYGNAGTKVVPKNVSGDIFYFELAPTLSSYSTANGYKDPLVTETYDTGSYNAARMFKEIRYTLVNTIYVNSFGIDLVHGDISQESIPNITSFNGGGNYFFKRYLYNTSGTSTTYAYSISQLKYCSFTTYNYSQTVNSYSSSNHILTLRQVATNHDTNLGNYMGYRPMVIPSKNSLITSDSFTFNVKVHDPASNLSQYHMMYYTSPSNGVILSNGDTYDPKWGALLFSGVGNSYETSTSIAGGYWGLDTPNLLLFRFAYQWAEIVPTSGVAIDENYVYKWNNNGAIYGLVSDLTSSNIATGTGTYTVRYTMTTDKVTPSSKTFQITHTGTSGVGTSNDNITIASSASSGYVDVVYFSNPSGYSATASITTVPSGCFSNVDNTTNNVPAAAVPTVLTASATVTFPTASTGGIITNDGGTSVTARGICYKTSPNVVSTDNPTSNGTGTGTFSSTISSLAYSTTYYYRAYATNSTGIGYGTELSFTTAATPTMGNTTGATSITATGAFSGGNIISDGGASLTAKGICWSTSSGPTISNSHTSDTPLAVGAFGSSISGLTGNTTYYVRCYATNVVGTSYGTQVTFTTATNLPTIGSATTVTSIGIKTASSGGNATSDGGSSITHKGICWSTSSSPTLSDPHTDNGTGTGSFTSSITGLSGSTRYYVKAYATNANGTSYSSSFVYFDTATPTIPTVDGTNSASSITSNSASSGGSIVDDGGSTITSYGVCWGTSSNPTITNSKTTVVGNFTGGFSGQTLSGLSSSTLYYIRAYATNSVGTGYAPQVSFTTSSSITINISTSLINGNPSTYVIAWQLNLTSSAPASVGFSATRTTANGLSTEAYVWNFSTGQSSDPGSNTVSYARRSVDYTATCTLGTIPTGYSAGTNASYVIPHL